MTLAAQEVDWVLAVEPWAYAYRIPSGEVVTIEITPDPDDPGRDFECPPGLRDGVWTVGIGSEDYLVTVGIARNRPEEI